MALPSNHRSVRGCLDSQKSDFLDSLDKFVTDMQEGLRSLVGGLELRKPEPKHVAALYTSADRSFRVDDPAIIQQFEKLLDDWCTKIESYLVEAAEAGESAMSNDAGPMSELDYWRRRMQRLTNITEQLKTKECKTVIGALSSVTKIQTDSNRNVFSLLRRWKQIDINITEAANEAKDNEKYLRTLEKFIEPLYNASPVQVIDTLPALMNSIKMIHTIARYYNTTDRMTGLFIKITNEMIANCKRCVMDGRSGDYLWKMDPEVLVDKLESCLGLNEA